MSKYIFIDVLLLSPYIGLVSCLYVMLTWFECLALVIEWVVYFAIFFPCGVLVMKV